MPDTRLTLHQRQYWAWLLQRRAASDSVESLASTLVDAQVDLNPHQVEAGRAFVEGEFFDTPKPERPIERVLTLATHGGDLVLDSFAGSGTTGAVAHKMGRRWIMVELGEHCHTHIIPRLKKVIDGQDPGGVTEAVGWQGGGGFRYAPSEVHWWQHGASSERDFICVTTQNLSAEQLQALAEDVGRERSLVVVCAAWRGVSAAAAAERWPNLTLKKIPRAVLDRCEWGHDDYSLNVANLPMAQPDPPPARVTVPTRARATRPAPEGQGALFQEDAQGDGGEA